MQRPKCVVCNQPATHVAVFPTGDAGVFKGSSVCNAHKEHPTTMTENEALVAAIEGFSLLAPSHRCDAEPKVEVS